MKPIKIDVLVKISIFSAISFVLMRFFEIPIPFLWPELKYDMSEVPAAIIGFSISPAAGVSVILIKNALHLITSFNLIGIIANTLVGVIFVGISASLYARDKKLKTAVSGMLFATVVMALVMMPVNFFLVRLFTGGQMPNMERLVFYSIPTFNLFKGALNAIITCILYKRVSKAFLKQGSGPTQPPENL
ncbi:MAG: Riboflavin transporter RibU [bacterium ADurb.Bin243]|nr:MAG: Riboflavin transporter RibU [bacterium ADurb.Bin243]